MRTLAFVALGAVGVLLWVVRERLWTVDCSAYSGICKDPPGPTHYVLRSEAWDRMNSANGNSGDALTGEACCPWEGSNRCCVNYPPTTDDSAEAWFI